LIAKRVSLIDFNYYHYRQREGSIMHSDNKDFRVRSLFAVIKALDQRAKKENDLQGVTEHIYNRIYGLFYSIGELLQQNDQSIFPDYPYFSELLIEIYPFLSYSQQRTCVSGLSRLISSLKNVTFP